LQDVAGMLRSFHYLAFAPLIAMKAGGPGSRTPPLTHWAEAWSRCAANRFLGRYYEISGGANYLPGSSQERGKLLEMYLLAKAVYELGYELNNRPSWVGIPLEGISGLLATRE
jgi:predicted trehalose synthase